MNILAEIKESFREGSSLTRLIYINLGLFFAIRIAYVFYFLSGTAFPFMDWLALPADFQVLATRPWTLITYMFLHFDFLHILFNVLWLFWMGRIFLDYFSESKLVILYLLGGITGGLCYGSRLQLISGLFENRSRLPPIGSISISYCHYYSISGISAKPQHSSDVYWSGKNEIPGSVFRF